MSSTVITRIHCETFRQLVQSPSQLIAVSSCHPEWTWVKFSRYTPQLDWQGKSSRDCYGDATGHICTLRGLGRNWFESGDVSEPDTQMNQHLHLFAVSERAAISLSRLSRALVFRISESPPRFPCTVLTVLFYVQYETKEKLFSSPSSLSLPAKLAWRMLKTSKRGRQTNAWGLSGQ